MPEIIYIRGEQASAGISTNGGCLVFYRAELQSGELDILRPCPEAVSGEVDPLMTACFPLVPYSNRIAHGRFRFRGNDYQVPLNFGEHPHSIHGIGWQSVWNIKRATGDEVALELDADGSRWPFSFHVTQTIRVSGADLRFCPGRDWPGG